MHLYIYTKRAYKLYEKSSCDSPSTTFNVARWLKTTEHTASNSCKDKGYSRVMWRVEDYDGKKAVVGWVCQNDIIFVGDTKNDFWANFYSQEELFKKLSDITYKDEPCGLCKTILHKIDQLDTLLKKALSKWDK